MNIQKTNLMLLNNRIMAGDKNTASAPVPNTQTAPDEGMKALSFLGMRNLMSNPGLAEKVNGEDNADKTANAPSFKMNALKKAAPKVLLAAASLVVTAPVLQGCIDQEQNVKVDNSAVTSMLSALLEELSAIRATQSADSQKAAVLMQMVKEMLDELKGVGGHVANMDETTMQIRMNFDKYLNLIKDHFDSEAEARAWLQAKIDSLDGTASSIVDFLSDIAAHVANIDKNVAELLTSFNLFSKGYQKNAAMGLFYDAVNAKNTTEMNAKMGKLLETGKNLEAGMGVIIAKADTIIDVVQKADSANQLGNEEIKYAIETARQYLGTKIKDQTWLQQLSDQQIIALFVENNKTDKKTLEELKALNKAYEEKRIEDKVYQEELKEILNGIGITLEAGVAALVEINKTNKDGFKKTNETLEKIKNYEKYNAQVTDAFFKSYLADRPGRIANTNALQELVKLAKNVDGTTTNIYNYLQNSGLDAETIEEFFKILNMHQEERTDRVVEVLERHLDNAELQLEVQDSIYAKMGELDSILQNMGHTGDTTYVSTGGCVWTRKDIEDLLKGQAGIMQILNEIDLNGEDANKLLADILAKELKCTCEHIDYREILINIYSRLKDEAVYAKQRRANTVNTERENTVRLNKLPGATYDAYEDFSNYLQSNIKKAVK